jgi:hypothetical protein
MAKHLPDISKLIALLSSENDAEALAALRAAQRRLKAVGADWHDVAAELERKQIANSVFSEFGTALSCQLCGNSMPHQRWSKRFCSPRCRVDFHRKSRRARHG